MYSWLVTPISRCVTASSAPRTLDRLRPEAARTNSRVAPQRKPKNGAKTKWAASTKYTCLRPRRACFRRGSSSSRTKVACSRACSWIVFGSSGIPGCYKEAEHCLQHRLATPSEVVHELEETQVDRQLLLRDPTMRAEPRPQQGPEPFPGVDVDLAEPVAIIITGELPGGVTDRAMGVAPFREPVVDVVLVGVDHTSRCDHRPNQRADGHLLNILQHPDHHLAG